MTVGLASVALGVAGVRLGLRDNVGAMVGVATRRVGVIVGRVVRVGVKVRVAVLIEVAVGSRVAVADAVAVSDGRETIVTVAVGRGLLFLISTKDVNKQPTKTNSPIPPRLNQVNTPVKFPSRYLLPSP